jgi:tetratricopeptide (TPR) repeat protein
MKKRLFFCGGLFLLLFSHGFAQNQGGAGADALAEYRNRNYESAVTICKSELALDPRNLDSHVVICWSLISLGRYEEALSYARQGRSLSRYDPRIIEILGEISYYQGRNSDGLDYFQEYVNLAPEGGRIDWVYYFIGEIYIRLGRFRHADIALSTAVHYVPGNAVWWTRLGYARENARELAAAVQAYERALALNAQYADARRGLERTRQAMALR